MTRLGSDFAFSFRLLHVRCDDRQLAPSSPLLSALQSVSCVRASARSDGVTSSECRQSQQVWSVTAALTAVDTIRASLVIDDAWAAWPPLSMLDGGQEVIERSGFGELIIEPSDGCWQAAFDNHSDARADESSVGGENKEALRVAVTLLAAVRSLPIPENMRV